MTILEKIQLSKKQEAADLRAWEADFRVRAGEQAPPAGFRAKLADSDHVPSLIAEVKKASPSRGLIRPNFDPAEVARAYSSAGADCLSVLTDSDFFQGDLENLQICQQTSGLPCLRKDFIVEPVQVWQSRALGADAILLILAILEDSEIEELGGLARELDMDILLEVHNEEEAARVPEWANLVGVNNRDLHTFSEDLGATARLSAALHKPGRVLVSESSINDHEGVLRVATAGARAILVGTAFCQEPDIESKVREVMAWR